MVLSEIARLLNLMSFWKLFMLRTSKADLSADAVILKDFCVNTGKVSGDATMVSLNIGLCTGKEMELKFQTERNMCTVVAIKLRSILRFLGPLRVLKYPCDKGLCGRAELPI